MPGSPCDPVAGPDQHDIELAVTRVAHQLAKSGAHGFHAADPVRVFLDDLESEISMDLDSYQQTTAGFSIENFSTTISV